MTKEQFDMTTQDESLVNWEPYHSMIWARYVVGNHTLEDIIEYMKGKGLKATFGLLCSRSYSLLFRYSGYFTASANTNGGIQATKT